MSLKEKIMTNAKNVVQATMLNVTLVVGNSSVATSIVSTPAGQEVLFSSPLLEGVARYASFISIEVNQNSCWSRAHDMAKQLRDVMDELLNNEEALNDIHSANMQRVLLDVPNFFVKYVLEAFPKQGFEVYTPVYNEVDGSVTAIV
jgi:hypothetical protein